MACGTMPGGLPRRQEGATNQILRNQRNQHGIFRHSGYFPWFMVRLWSVLKIRSRHRVGQPDAEPQLTVREERQVPLQRNVGRPQLWCEPRYGQGRRHKLRHVRLHPKGCVCAEHRPRRYGIELARYRVGLSGMPERIQSDVLQHHETLRGDSTGKAFAL